MLRAISIKVLSLATIIGGFGPRAEPLAPSMEMRTSPYAPEAMLLRTKGADAASALASETNVTAFLDDLDAPGSGVMTSFFSPVL